jgi:hypothetical protein
MDHRHTLLSQLFRSPEKHKTLQSVKVARPQSPGGFLGRVSLNIE